MRKLWSHASLAGTASLIGMALIVLGVMAASAPDARAGCNHLGNDGGCPNGITPGSTSVAILAGNVILWSDGNISFGNCCIAPSNTETPGGLHDLTEGAGSGPGAASQFGAGGSEFGGNNIPTADNEALFSLLGTIYGGDGQTTFGLPDLRGRAPVIGRRSSGPGTTPTPLTHVVSSGENLYRIALLYNVSMESIASANNIANANLIFVGQELKIPQTSDTGSTGAVVNVSGGVMSGGYLFPTGTTAEVGEEAAGRDVDFFRPLILQYPDDLGRRSLVIRDTSNLDCGTTNSCGNDSILPLPLSFGSCSETALCSQPPFVQSYQVQAGDTMASIAARHNVTVAELAAANFSGGGVPEGVLPTGALMGIPAPSTPQPEIVFTDQTSANLDRIIAGITVDQTTDGAPPGGSTTTAAAPPLPPVTFTRPADADAELFQFGNNYGRTVVRTGADGKHYLYGHPDGLYPNHNFGQTTEDGRRSEGGGRRSWDLPRHIDPDSEEARTIRTARATAGLRTAVSASDIEGVGGFADGFDSGDVSNWSTISARRLKTDIVRIGALPSGLSVYRYRYIWSAKRHIGVMAQEAMLLYPDAVHEINGFFAVDYARIR